MIDFAALAQQKRSEMDDWELRWFMSDLIWDSRSPYWILREAAAAGMRAAVREMGGG